MWLTSLGLKKCIQKLDYVCWITTYCSFLGELFLYDKFAVCPSAFHQYFVIHFFHFSCFFSSDNLACQSTFLIFLWLFCWSFVDFLLMNAIVLCFSLCVPSVLSFLFFSVTPFLFISVPLTPSTHTIPLSARKDVSIPTSPPTSLTRSTTDHLMPGSRSSAGPTPTAPRDVVASLVSTRFIKLTWRLPAEPHGDDVTYSVYYSLEGTNRHDICVIYVPIFRTIHYYYFPLPEHFCTLLKIRGTRKEYFAVMPYKNSFISQITYVKGSTRDTN